MTAYVLQFQLMQYSHLHYDLFLQTICQVLWLEFDLNKELNTFLNCRMGSVPS